MTPSLVVNESDIAQSPSVITITTSGSTFTPVITLSATAVVTWTLPGGTTSSATTLNVNWGTSATRTTTLNVEPWSAVQRLNFGYDAEDNGSNAIELVNQCGVTSLSGLEAVKDTLGQLCLSHNVGLQTLDLSNFVNLDTIECYQCSGLKHVYLHNTHKLARICLEQCALEDLNVSECPAVADIRAAINAYNGITFGSVGKALWHLCVRDTATTHIELPSMRQFPLMEEFYVWNNDYRGTLDFNTGVASVLRQVAAAGCNYTSADFTDRFIDANDPGIIDMEGCELTTIVLTGCTNVRTLYLANNHFSEAQVDGILLQLVTGAKTNGTVNLRGSAVPSVTGDGYVTTLRSRGWTVTTTATAALVSIAVTPDITTVREGATRQFTATGSYDDLSTANITTSVTWASSDATHATIGASTGLATGIAESTSNEVTITATLGLISNSTTLTVTAPAALASIAITPDASSVAEGATLQLTATGTYDDLSTADVTTSAIWASSDATHATIGASTGLVTGVALSTASELIISATVGAIADTTTLTVTEGVAAGTMVFTSETQTVRLDCTVFGTPTILWDLTGASDSTVAAPGLIDFGSAAHRSHTLTVTPPSALTHFTVLFGDPGVNISSISNLSGFTALRSIYAYGNSELTHLDISGCAALESLYLESTGLSTAEMDQIYIDLNAAVDHAGTIAPRPSTSASSAARTALIAKGWTGVATP
jgi:hypothetical protein